MFQNFKKNFRVLYKIYRILYILSERIARSHIFMNASAISFNILLYQIPLLFLTLYIVNLSGLLSDLDTQIMDLIKDFLPPTSISSEYIETLVNEVEKIINNSRLFGIVGIVTLLWLSSSLVSAIRYALNTIFRIPMQNVFIVYRFRDILVVIATSILILLYALVIPIVGFVQEFVVDLFPDWVPGLALISELMITATTLITGFMFFYLVYKFIPTDSIPRKVRALATLLSTLIIEATRHIFAWYLVGLSSYGKFYGGYAVVVSIALWIYYSSTILLLSAEISKFYFDMKKFRHRKKMIKWL